MNKLIILLMVVGFSAASLIAPNLPRHVNPQQISPELPSGLDLLLFYGSIVDAAVNRNFTYASERLQGLTFVHVPENIKYIYTRFNELLDKEISKLNETDRFLAEAERELSQGFLDDARGRLEKAGRSLAEAELIQGELRDSSDELAGAIGMPLSRLSNQFKRLESLIELYHKELASLSEHLKQLREERLLNTKLTLWVNFSEVLIGSWLQVHGLLHDEYGRPLDGRRVVVYINGGKVGDIITREDGSFYDVVRVPYIYEPEVELFAEYTPGQEDFGKFKACRSNIVTLKLIYDVPLITAFTDKSDLTPLETFEISGRVSTTSHVLPGEIHVNAFGDKVSAEISEKGDFRIIMSVPESASSGSHKIVLYTKPYEILAPARKMLRINVYRIPTHLVVKAPAMVLSGTQIQIRGELFTGKGLGRRSGNIGNITVESFGQACSFPVDGGSFLVNLTIPLTASSGLMRMRVMFNPSTPIYEASEAQVEIFVMNPIMMLIPLSAALYLTSVGVKELSRRRKTIPERWTAEIAEKAEPKSIVRRPEGITGIYLEAVRMIEELTGLKMKASDTIREFLDKVTWELGEISPAFTELSYMTEAAVYGGLQPDMELARALLEAIRREIYEA